MNSPSTKPRRRRALVVLLSVSAALLLASWLALESSPKPCNVDDFTGCSSLGAVAVLGFLVLLPVSIGLALILALAWVGDLLRRR
jgi:hypothetical protein